MGVQVFEDHNDRQFWVIGSALDANPVTVVQDVQDHCRPSSIKFVMITSVESMWVRMLAPYFFHRYLKPELALVHLDEIDVLMSVSKSVSKPVSKTDLATVGMTVATSLDRHRTELLTEVQVVTSLRDNPALADYADRKLLELQARIREFETVESSTLGAIQGAMSSLHIEAASRQ